MFKDQHPELGSNLQILAKLRLELQNREDALNTALKQDANPLEQPGSPKPGDGTPIGALEEELNKLKAQLDDLRSRGYTERHPDVRKLTELIAEKEKSLTDLEAAAPSSASGRPPAATPPDVDSREREIAALKAKISHYQELLNQEPALEQQFADLTRGYDQLKAHYDDLLNKKAASEMVINQLKRHPGELLLTIDLTRLPLKPDFPNRIKLCGIGLGIGLALGTILTGGPSIWMTVYPRRESTRGITRASALGNSRDHHPGREKKAPEEPQVDMGADRFCLCHDSGRINHQLPLGVMWLRQLAIALWMRTAPDLAQRAV